MNGAALHRTTRWFGLFFALALAAGVASAQGSSSVAGSAAANPVQQEVTPFEWGVLAQGGFGVTEDRGSFKFFMAGVHAGKVLTSNFGPGKLRGDFEYAVEVFPLWQSYTPVTQRQNCVPISGSSSFNCSAPFNIGGRFTGASITPIILRWNFAGTRRVAPWVQGAGGVIWTNHKYPAFGGPPAVPAGVTQR